MTGLVWMKSAPPHHSGQHQIYFQRQVGLRDGSIDHIGVGIRFPRTQNPHKVLTLENMRHEERMYMNMRSMYMVFGDLITYLQREMTSSRVAGWALSYCIPHAPWHQSSRHLGSLYGWHPPYPIQHSEGQDSPFASNYEDRHRRRQWVVLFQDHAAWWYK